MGIPRRKYTSKSKEAQNGKTLDQHFSISPEASFETVADPLSSN
jgi:hypothetical protein